MEKTTRYCDICGVEVGIPRKGEYRIMVIFTTEQNEGRSSEPYIEIVKADLCEPCRRKILNGNAVFAEGAMGHNRYFFKS